jgi:hypothetical protein
MDMNEWREEMAMRIKFDNIVYGEYRHAGFRDAERMIEAVSNLTDEDFQEAVYQIWDTFECSGPGHGAFPSDAFKFVMYDNGTRSTADGTIEGYSAPFCQICKDRADAWNFAKIDEDDGYAEVEGIKIVMERMMKVVRDRLSNLGRHPAGWSVPMMALNDSILAVIEGFYTIREPYEMFTLAQYDNLRQIWVKNTILNKAFPLPNIPPQIWSGS